ncbi:Putative 115 kDa protein in type-1 retrotransposable element R1DM [Eumeta japonica]|uniref:115 kDa protein in type-1 retrotransposable element R1DM n=1 Tax=Eumeta variegata TaxID=151549 RepID=A0A4C2A3W1_EUMVA|nr:Putative 115 kDa protein in type-1 retrotransposable element R1DM [Eumeta japonica]
MPSKPLRHGNGLPERRVVVRYAGGESRRMTSKGCIQGSIAGPTFWNLVLDSLLRELGDLGVYVQAFADDVVLMFSGQSASALEAETNRALAHKTEVRCPGHSHGQHKKNALVDEIRLPRSYNRQGLTFIPRSQGVQRAASIYKGIARAAKATWGLSPEIVRTIYVAAIEPIVTYASCAWAPATKKLGVRKMLDALQRSVALKACRAYRTVSLHSALILASSRSPWTSAKCRIPRTLPNSGSRALKTWIHQQSTVSPLSGHIYTDGVRPKVSRCGPDRVAGRNPNSTFRLESFCTVFQAEMFALHRAIKRVKEGKDRLVNIFSDSKSSLQMTAYLQPSGPCSAKTSGISLRKAGKCAYSGCGHAGNHGNERADELARNAALKKRQRITIAIRCRTQKVIRAASLDEWQQRYTEGGTGEITKCFFPEWKGRIGSSRFTITPR